MDHEIKTEEESPKTLQNQTHSATPINETKRAKKFITPLNLIQV